MDKNTKHFGEKDISNENINGILTSESFKTYSIIQDPKKRFNFRIMLLYLVVASLLTTSAFIFASSIKTAFFNNSDKKEDAEKNINTIQSVRENNALLKVENVSQELSGLFDIPVGVKIVALDNTVPSFTGLKVNDIIVEVSGKSVQTIEDMNEIVKLLEEENMLTYKVYRNGVYKNINPYDELSNE